MPKIRMRAAPFAVLIAALVLGLTPAAAHEGERHGAAPAAHQHSGHQSRPAEQTPDAEAAPAEMRWPTAEDLQGAAEHEERPKTFAGRLIRWLGAWHPAVVHFPIALILTVAFLELAAAVRRKPSFGARNKTLLAIAAVSAFAAAPLGWISAGLPSPEDEPALTIHRWLGTATPFLILLVWALKRPAEAALRKPPAYGALLAAAVLAIIAQAYFGAQVTHGAEHLAF